MISNIIIEGVDRLGKDTLISNIMHELGFFQLVHYQKPMKLKALDDSLEDFQRFSFEKMFSMLDHGKMLLNRAHLGEVVYAPRYRGYTGDYVFDIEQNHPVARNNTLLVLLTASSWDPIKDDGDSFDFSKKGEEQEDFIRAFHLSNIRSKLIIDVTRDSKFVSPLEILNLVIDEL